MKVIKPNLSNIYLTLSFLGFIFVLFFNHNKYYSRLFLLPFSYFIINFMFKLITVNIKRIKENQYKGGIAYQIIISVIFIRYIITPISIVLTGNYSGVGIDPDIGEINLAITLMILELLAVTFTINLSLMHYIKKSINYYDDMKSKNFGIKSMPLNIVVIVFTFLSLLLLLVVDYHLLLPENLYLLNDTYEDAGVGLSGGYYLLSNFVKMSLLLIGLSYLKQKYDNKNKNIYIFLSFVISIIYMGLMTSTKRWDILFSGILCIYLITKLYKKIPKSYLIVTFIIMIVSIISISMYKFSWYFENSKEPFHTVIDLALNSFQGYFSGPRNVAQSIQMKTLFGQKITAETFINDFLGGVPVLSRRIDQMNRINHYFNLSIGLSSASQIIPMIGIGYNYFPLLCPLLSVFCEWLAVRMDFCIYRTNRMEYMFLYLYGALYLSMCMGFSAQIIFTGFVNRLLPMFLLFFVNKRIILNNKQQKSS